MMLAFVNANFVIILIARRGRQKPCTPALKRPNFLLLLLEENTAVDEQAQKSFFIVGAA